MSTQSILFVLTTVDKDLKGIPTGWYLPELAHPYLIFNDAGWSIDLASIQGPNPPVDKKSIDLLENGAGKSFLEDPTVKNKLSKAKKLSEVNVDDYDVIFYVGGHGPAIDLPTDAANIKVAQEFYRKGKVIAAICHGPAALVNVTGEDGKPIFSGKKFTGFSNAEEKKAERIESVPFLLEDKISAQGGIYRLAVELGGPKVVVDGKLFTGQNPASAKPLAEAILKHFQ